jgi:hypothetical protein
MSHLSARNRPVEGLEATKLALNNKKFGLHSCRVSALTSAVNTGMFSQIRLQNLGRWANIESAARYFLPREQEQAKVGKERG